MPLAETGGSRSAALNMSSLSCSSSSGSYLFLFGWSTALMLLVFPLEYAIGLELPAARPDRLLSGERLYRLLPSSKSSGKLLLNKNQS